ncbi:hypothetical protein ACGFOM_20190 [Streptomyces sp. NPDC048594]|uniref:hypothetical protein n=1 Tax=Streptomyces sp. NPDC048594 TaxID=3365575 RepID=UPI0037191AD6
MREQRHPGASAPDGTAPDSASPDPHSPDGSTDAGRPPATALVSDTPTTAAPAPKRAANVAARAIGAPSAK